MQPMQLFVDTHYASPYALSVFVALCEKKRPFEVATIDLSGGEHHRPEYAKLSLTHRVPTLVDGEFSLSESSAITEYLHETYPGPALYPADAKARARARQVQAWLRSDLTSIRSERSTVVLFYGPSTTPLSIDAQAAVEKLFTVADALLAHGKSCLFGDEWCIADVDLAVMLNRLVLNGDPVPDHLAKYAANQWQRPSVQLWVNHTRPPL
ncbi:MAG TPA: glutathione transferase [Accumulibacter sp.]|nr:glutathione transferase [Accumulibacter sp.]HMW17374.1 glutathione transferase [Accumulibacter sp.]HMY06451.1 glutathione transferase [Accumulibacter sp.]HNC16992.1 glutathione transferase [Accumulibacter sp.]HND80984.1 glutathione transferase [Accumulibacter sp.]